MATLITLHCLLFLVLYNIAIVTNSQYVHSPISSPPALPYAPTPRSIPYPATPVFPGVPISRSPNDPVMPVLSPSTSSYAPTPRSIPYPSTPVSLDVPMSYSPSDTAMLVSSPPTSSCAPTSRSIPYPATPVSPGIPISYSPSDNAMPISSPSYAPSPRSIPYSTTPISHSPSAPTSTMPIYFPPTSSYAPTPKSIPYPTTPISPPSDPAMPVSPHTSYAPAPETIPYPTTPVPGVPVSHPPSYPTVPATPAPAPGPIECVHNPPGIKAAYWPAFNGLDPSTINTTYLTHIYYAFLLIDGDTYKLSVTPSDEKLIPEFINTLRRKTPPVKTLFSIGGFNFNQTNYFSNMSTTELRRAIFINSTIEIARNYGFDGVDLDWEYPSNNQEMFNLAILFKQWRKSLEIESRVAGKPRLLLTAAVYYSSKFTNYGEPRSYPVQAINSYTDWINPMCYDYHGSWENFTGINAALFDPNSNLSTSYGVGSWIGSGVLPEKVVMGLPLYGRTWKLLDPNMNWIGAPAVGTGPGDGVLSYSDILEFNNNGTDKGRVYFDGGMVSYYSISGYSWVGYDDTMSIDRKVEYARSLNLGGYFFWALGMDNNGILIRQASNSWDVK